jgi:hypothetical protein
MGVVKSIIKMSWSASFIGNPEKVVEALNKQSEGLTGNSKTEFDAALPNLIGLINQNFHSNPDYKPVLKIEANGHGNDGERNCSVKIERIYGVLV